MPEMASPAPSSRLQNAFKYYRKVRKMGPKCRKGLITPKWCELQQKVSVLRRQRRLQISRVKNIGGVFELSGVAFRLVPSYGGILVLYLAPLSSPSRGKQFGLFLFLFFGYYLLLLRAVSAPSDPFRTSWKFDSETAAEQKTSKTRKAHKLWD